MDTRHTSDLRKGRLSLAGARYFFTVCARRPEHRLTTNTCAQAIALALARLERDGDWKVMASTIMPDHLHVVATFSGRLSAGQVMGKLKTLTRPALASARARWQENFHEHRLRPEDSTGNFARYIFLNPYRGKQIGRREEWPFWSKAQDHDFDFIHMLDAGRWPPEEWLTADIESLGVSGQAVGRD